jgi:hypothetical protein
LDSPFAPFSILAWSAALQAIDKSPSCLIEASKTLKCYGHYAFPDPGFLVNHTSDKLIAHHIASWLRVCDTWILRLGNESSLALSSQNWRTLLTMDLGVKVEGTTKTANRRREVLRLLLPKPGASPELKIQSTLKDTCVWQGKEFPSNALPPEDVVRQILWELYELNFIHELVSLDRRACAELDATDVMQLIERENKISRCFPLDSFRHITFASENRGLAADAFNKRFHYIVNLFLVMKAWKGKQPAIFGASEDTVREFTQTAAMGFEKVVVKYYCQQFFNYFGRAAQIPHRLFRSDNS